jgi:hypothetical protein
MPNDAKDGTHLTVPSSNAAFKSHAFKGQALSKKATPPTNQNLHALRPDELPGWAFKIHSFYLSLTRIGVSGHGRSFDEGSVVDSWDSWYVPSRLVATPPALLEECFDAASVC